MLDIRDPVSRVSLDTFYQVDFSFGKQSIWLRGNQPGLNRTQGLDFTTKMSLLCTQAEIPGTSYLTTQAVGHHQGIQEIFPTLRQFPPLNLTFYVDADHLIPSSFSVIILNSNLRSSQNSRAAFHLA